MARRVDFHDHAAGARDSGTARIVGGVSLVLRRVGESGLRRRHAQEVAREYPEDLLAAAANCWQLVGDISEAEKWWDAGLSPLDQRALDYRAAGLLPADLARHLGPYTVLEHLRRGSSPAWCVARLRRQRRDGVS